MITVRVSVIDGQCSAGRHKPGDVFMVEQTTPGGLCIGAWNAIAPYVMSLRFGANFPWEREGGTAHIHCPDPKGITFELKRVERRVGDTPP